MPYRTPAKPPSNTNILLDAIARVSAAVLLAVLRLLRSMALVVGDTLAHASFDHEHSGPFYRGALLSTVCLVTALFLAIWAMPPRFNKPPAKEGCEFAIVDVTPDSLTLEGERRDATPEEQEEYAQTCETICVTSNMWPIASHRQIYMDGWSTCTCIEERPGRERPRVVVFRGAHFERSEVIFEGQPPAAEPRSRWGGAP